MFATLKPVSHRKHFLGSSYLKSALATSNAAAKTTFKVTLAHRWRHHSTACARFPNSV